MSRQLRILSAGTLAGIDQPLTVVLNILSEDLKAQPVHSIPLTHAQAITLARQLLASIEHVDTMTAEVAGVVLSPEEAALTRRAVLFVAQKSQEGPELYALAARLEAAS